MKTSKMNKTAISEPRHSLERERAGFTGANTGRRKSGHGGEIDWNTLLFGKKVSVTHRGLAEADVDAPRNSLESSPGTRTPRFSGVRHDDIPYSVEISKTALQPHYGSRYGDIHRSGELMKSSRKKAGTVQAEVLPIKTLIAQDSCEAEYERRRRSAPSVVARLMGLDTLPDKLSKGNSSAKPPKPSKASHGSKKESKLQPGRAESSSRPPSPLRELDTIKDFPLPRILGGGGGQTDSDGGCEDNRMTTDVFPFRAHPQERQLQEFKKEFMEKLANQKYGAPSDREVEAKRSFLREKLSEAKLALASGGDESKRLKSAQEKLMESKEFQDAIELLQTNKEFFKKFFPEPNSLSSFSNKDPPEPESVSRRSFHLEDFCRDNARHDDASREPRRSFHLGDFSKDSRKSSFLEDDLSSREFSRRSLLLEDLSAEPRTFHHSPKDSSGRRSLYAEDASRDSGSSLRRGGSDVSKEIRALEEYSDSRHGDGTSRRGHSASEHRKRRESRHKPSAVSNSVSEELAIVQAYKDRDREASFCPTPDNNFNGRHGSPISNVDSRKGASSPSRIVVLKPGPGEIALLSPLLAPNSSPHSFGYQSGLESLRDPRERFSPPRTEENRYPRVAEAREGYRDPRVDPRAIARDIVREARTNSTRELSRERDVGKQSPKPGDGNLPRITGGSFGQRLGLSQYSHSVGSKDEIFPESAEAMGDFNLRSSSRCHAIEDRSRFSSAIVPDASPRVRSQETATTSESSSRKEAWKQRRSSEKPKVLFEIEEQDEIGLADVRKAASQVQDRNLSHMIPRPRTYLPGIKGRAEFLPESQIRGDEWKNVDGNMYNTLPKTEKILKVKTMYSGNHNVNAGDESRESSPQTSSKLRLVPNASAMAGAKIRSGEIFSRVGSHGNHVVGPERMDSSEHFYLKEKRAEARQAALRSKKKAPGDASTSGRSSSHQAWPSEGDSAVQDVHIDMNKGCALALQPHNLSVMTRISHDPATPIEGDPRLGTRACEQDLLETRPQRTPQLFSESTDKAEADHVRKLSSHKQLEVPVNKQGSRKSEAWSLATPTFENGDGDGASETSVDKCGQPSPVSVLDSPFEVEVPSPVEEFQELSSDLQDLRLRLRLLKLDGSDRSSTLGDSLQAKEKLTTESVVVRHTDNSLESIESTSTSYSSYKDLESHIPQQSQESLERCNSEGLPCPKDKQEELLYVLNLLVASGFTESSAKIITRWHSPACPLEPGLYERLEDYYVDVDLQIAVEQGNIKSQGSYHRRLLFDVVNEVLLLLLGPYLNYRPWVQPFAPRLRPIPTNHQLVRDTWLEICTCFSPEGVEDFEALDSLMIRDISRGKPWLDSPEIREEIGLELERTIFDSLIEETVYSLILPTK